IATPMTGWLANRLGWRNTMFCTVLGFTTASFLCGIANSLEALVMARIAQGLCGAPIMPMGQAILLGTFPRHLQPLALVMWGVGAVGGCVWPRPRTDPRQHRDRSLQLARCLLHDRATRHVHAGVHLVRSGRSH